MIPQAFFGFTRDARGGRDMLRYCGTCRKEYDFKVTSMKDMDNLVCPVCGDRVDKNSKAPARPDPDKAGETVGNIAAGFLYIIYVFYFVCAIVGLLAYVLKEDRILYFVTALSVGMFFLSILMGRLRFITGFILLPAGAAAGFAAFGGLRGACAGMMLIFFVRFIIKDLILSLFWKLISAAGKQ